MTWKDDFKHYLIVYVNPSYDEGTSRSLRALNSELRAKRHHDENKQYFAWILHVQLDDTYSQYARAHICPCYTVKQRNYKEA